MGNSDDVLAVVFHRIIGKIYLTKPERYIYNVNVINWRCRKTAISKRKFKP